MAADAALQREGLTDNGRLYVSDEHLRAAPPGLRGLALP